MVKLLQLIKNVNHAAFNGLQRLNNFSAPNLFTILNTVRNLEKHHCWHFFYI